MMYYQRTVSDLRFGVGVQALIFIVTYEKNKYRKPIHHTKLVQGSNQSSAFYQFSAKLHVLQAQYQFFLQM